MNGKNDNLESLMLRRNKLLRQRVKLLQCETEDRVNNSKSMSDTSNSVIEDSDVESATQSFNSTKLPNITVLNSSSDQDISTSTVQFPATHTYFTAKDVGFENNKIQKSTTEKNNNAKIQITSNCAVNVKFDKENNILNIQKLKKTANSVNSVANSTNLVENRSATSPSIISETEVSPQLSTSNDDQQLNNSLDVKKMTNCTSPVASESAISPSIFLQEEVSPQPSTSIDKQLNNNLDDSTLINCTSPVSNKSTISPSIIFQTEIRPQPSTSNDDQQLNNDLYLGHNEQRQNKRKHRASRNVKKVYLDFTSDEENFICNDFSSGSSDNWNTNDTETDSSSNEHNVKIKKKKLVKRKAQGISHEDKVIPVLKEKKVNKRKARKSLKEEGKAYETHSGKLKEAKSMKNNPCVDGKCPRQCFDISEERRKKIFDYYWGLNAQRKKDWLICHAKCIIIKRKKTKNDCSRRGKSYEYYINEGEGRRPVCQQFLLKTLDISQHYLLYTLQNEEIEGLAKQDKRKVNVTTGQYDEETKQSAREFLENLPAVPSHYCRKSSKRLYLPQEFKNVTNLYSIYRNKLANENKSFLSQRLFTNLFKTDFNYSFYVPKKDKCTLCTQHENNPDNTDDQVFSQHIEEKKAMQARFHFHQQLNVPGNTTVVASFDLQKVLNTPYGESMLLYYSRKYAVYNCTMYESITRNGYCYVWGECDGKRGSNEIGSCLFKYLKEVDIRGVQRLILYCDSCAGQNKNKTVVSILRFFLLSSNNLATIQINYLLPGHTYMPVDSMHATIEREVRKLTVWAPSQWPTLMESARKNPRPYNVHVLDHKEFIDFDIVTSKTMTPNIIKNKEFRMKDVKIVTLKKSDLNVMTVKYTMNADGEAYPIKLNEYVEITSKGKGRGKSTRRVKCDKEKEINENISTCFSSTSWQPNDDLKPLYNRRLPIANQKYQDLKRLCDNGTIPKRYHAEYLTLPSSMTLKATLAETDDSESSNEED